MQQKTNKNSHKKIQKRKYINAQKFFIDKRKER